MQFFPNNRSPEWKPGRETLMRNRLLSAPAALPCWPPAAETVAGGYDDVENPALSVGLNDSVGAPTGRARSGCTPGTRTLSRIPWSLALHTVPAGATVPITDTALFAAMARAQLRGTPWPAKDTVEFNLVAPNSPAPRRPGKPLLGGFPLVKASAGLFRFQRMAGGTITYPDAKGSPGSRACHGRARFRATRQRGLGGAQLGLEIHFHSGLAYKAAVGADGSFVLARMAAGRYEVKAVSGTTKSIPRRIPWSREGISPRPTGAKPISSGLSAESFPQVTEQPWPDHGRPFDPPPSPRPDLSPALLPGSTACPAPHRRPCPVGRPCGNGIPHQTDPGGVTRARGAHGLPLRFGDRRPRNSRIRPDDRGNPGGSVPWEPGRGIPAPDRARRPGPLRPASAQGSPDPSTGIRTWIARPAGRNAAPRTGFPRMRISPTETPPGYGGKAGDGNVEGHEFPSASAAAGESETLSPGLMDLATASGRERK